MLRELRYAVSTKTFTAQACVLVQACGRQHDAVHTLEIRAHEPGACAYGLHTVLYAYTHTEHVTWDSWT